MRFVSKKRAKKLQDVIRRKEDNVVFVDFVLLSMINSVDNWYADYYQADPKNLIRKAHTFHLVSFYNRERFSNYTTLRKERDAYLEEVDLYVQMRRDD